MRELRALSRSRSYYVFRLLAALVGVLEILAFLPSYNAQASSAIWMFNALHFTAFLAIWLLTPFFAADSISRERREGTLGLLLLTPLRPWEVVAAKGLAHGLRGATLWLAVLPALTVPVMLGGVAWQSVLCSFLILGTSLAFALSAGLLASTLCVERHRALFLAALFAVVLFALQAEWFGLWLDLWLGLAPTSFLWNALQLAFNSAQISGTLAMPTNMTVHLIAVITAAMIAQILPVLVFVWAIVRVRAIGQDMPPPRWRIRLAETLSRPMIGRGFHRAWLRRYLSRNPIAWLGARRWTTRAVMLLWLGGTCMALAALFLSSSPALSRLHQEVFKGLFFLLALCLALDSASGFFRERAGSMLELVLISPLEEWRLVTGQARALLGRYVPAAVFLYLAWWLTQPSRPWYAQPEPPAIWLGYFAIALPFLPFAGLYFALRCAHFTRAVLGTLAVGMLVPWLATRIFWADLIVQSARHYDYGQGRVELAPINFLVSLNGWPPLLVQAAIAAFLGWAMHWRLKDRHFAQG